ncbi:Adenylate kinase isoenzyme 1 [Geodia barretti]|uniref:Adenylate kinase isoenzyme 1 n=1 Tax=Geodia barretti TaxID=519541 RepID=A0AA35SPP1_GEOBA|nr:Adenylate kinase isoenzyme 1 [Geodia barretti]
MTANTGSELARDYLARQNIPQLFESLIAGLAYHRPDDPISFLQRCLEEAKTRGPGCGKGTQCEKLAKEFGLVHLSSGDLLREEVARGSLRGREIQEIMTEGKLVPPEVTVRLLKSAINSVGDANGFLIDGFPRELAQAHMFEQQVGECAAVVVFECGEEVLVERLRKRGETSGRVDNNDDTIRKRLTTFSASTLPVVQHYQSLGRTRMVDASGTVDKVSSEDKIIFRQLLADH